MSAKRVYFDNLRSIAFGDISAAYAAIGPTLTVEPRIMCVTNATDSDVIVSTSATNVVGNLFIAKGSFKLFDLTSNMVPGKDDGFVIAKAETMYVKQAGAVAATLGGVYIEYIYGQT